MKEKGLSHKQNGQGSNYRERKNDECRSRRQQRYSRCQTRRLRTEKGLFKSIVEKLEKDIEKMYVNCMKA